MDQGCFYSEFLESPAPFLLMVLLGFDEEEYVNGLEEDEDVATNVVAPSNGVVQLTEDEGQTTMEVMPPSTKATQLEEEAGQIIAKGTSGDVAQDPLLEL